MKDVKIKADFEYDNISFTVVGLVDKKDFDSDVEGYGLGYIEDSDMMTDAMGYNMHTVLEGNKELEAYYLIGDDGVGTASIEVIEGGEE